VIMALLFIGLMAIIGLAIDLGNVFVSYSRLRRAVDAAALASTSQFREGYTQIALERAAQQFLNLNGITNTVDVTIEACSFAVIPNDPELCTTPTRKLVRVTVTQDVNLFFLAVMGLNTVPIKVDAISEAASVDLVLLIDNSSSMAQTNTGADTNPKDCNPSSNCHPMEEIKAAAKLLVNRLFLSQGGAPGYDRVSIVTFNRFPKVELEMTDNKATIMSKIDAITVYQGEYKCPFAFDNGQTYAQWLPLWLAEPVPLGDPPNSITGLEGPCRLHWGGSTNTDSGLLNPDGAYITLYSLQMYESETAAEPNPKDWMVTNSGGGLKVAGNVLGGQYPAGYPSSPVRRESALWVVVWLTDGYTNAGYSEDGEHHPQSVSNSGTMICPKYTWAPITGYPDTRWCVDQDARPTAAQLQATPAPGASVFAPRHAQDPVGTAVEDRVYDPDDYARDMVDFVTNPDTALPPEIKGQGALLFTIGLGTKINSRSQYEIANNRPAPGSTLLEYGAYKGSGIYYPAPNANQLDEIFLAIANKIATRLSR